MADELPDIDSVLASVRAVVYRLDVIEDQIENLRVRRPSPSGAVIPEVDTKGRLTSLYLAPGTVDRFSSAELVAEIMAGIRDSVAEAAEQTRLIVDSINDEEPGADEATGPNERQAG